MNRQFISDYVGGGWLVGFPVHPYLACIRRIRLYVPVKTMSEMRAVLEDSLRLSLRRTQFNSFVHRYVNVLGLGL